MQANKVLKGRNSSLQYRKCGISHKSNDHATVSTLLCKYLEVQRTFCLFTGFAVYTVGTDRRRSHIGMTWQCLSGANTIIRLHRLLKSCGFISEILLKRLEKSSVLLLSRLSSLLHAVYRKIALDKSAPTGYT